MLILPPGHGQAVNQVRRLTDREKWIVRGAATVIVAAVIALVVALAVGAGPRSSNGCIYATIPGPVGAQQVHECGAQARNTCATVFQAGAYTQGAANVVAAECSKAGLPVTR